MQYEGFRVLFLAASVVLNVTAPEKAAAVQEPQYDPATEISILTAITEVREAPHGSSFSGIHLTVKSDSQVLDVYLGPAEFVKQFDMRFAKGDEVRVTGSKVKTTNGSHVVLAREVRKEQATLFCRRARGEPNWE
jgi:hypothetical protein